MIGKIFGKLKVLSLARKQKAQVAETFWFCSCECGEEVEAPQSKLVSTDMISCGCVKQERGAKNKAWKGEGEIKASYWHRVVSSAAVREKEMRITSEQAWNLALVQNKKCALSGLDLEFSSDPYKQTASLDRIDSSKGYIEGNVQWVHKKINKAKGTFSQEEFIEICSQVTSWTKTGKIETIQ